MTTCGFLETNDYVVSQVILSGNSTRFNVNGQSYQLPLLGKHHAQNASFVIALAEKLQINHENIQAGMQGLEYSNMRFEQLIGRNGVTLINDAYNASPTSMKAAIEVVKQLSGYKDKIVVLGDVLELGEYSESLHRSIADVIDTNIQYVYLYGDATKFIHDALITKQLDMHIQHFTNKDALLEKLVKHTNKETMILFKASRGMKFEQFIEALMA